MKRTLGALIAGVMLVSACSSGPTATIGPTGAAPTATSAAQATPTTAAEQQTLVVWTRNYTVSDDSPSPFFSARDELQAKHPNVTVELSGVGYDPQYNRLLLSQAGAVEDKPDVFLIDNIWLGQFVENGMAVNLDSYYASWDGKDDIVDAYRESTIWNGSQYGVWAWSDIRLLIWNKDVFRSAGLDPEKGPETWDDVFAAAQAIKDNVPGVWPVGFPAASQEATADRFYSYLFMTGSTILNDDNTQAAFNDAGGQKAVQFLVDLVNRGYTPQDVLGQDADAIVDGVLAGSYGMMLATVGDSYAARPEGMTTEEFRNKFGAILPPLCSDGCQAATSAGGYMLAINADSDKQDLAWEYIMDVTDGANMLPFEGATVRVPVRKSGLAQLEAFTEDPYFDQSARAAEIAHFPPFVAQYTEMLEPIWTAIQLAIQGTPVQEALDGAAADVNGILSR